MRIGMGARGMSGKWEWESDVGLRIDGNDDRNDSTGKWER